MLQLTAQGLPVSATAHNQLVAAEFHLLGLQGFDHEKHIRVSAVLS